MGCKGSLLPFEQLRLVKPAKPLTKKQRRDMLDNFLTLKVRDKRIKPSWRKEILKSFDQGAEIVYKAEEDGLMGIETVLTNRYIFK